MPDPFASAVYHVTPAMWPCPIFWHRPFRSDTARPHGLHPPVKPLLDAVVGIADAEILGHVRRADQVRVLESLGWAPSPIRRHGSELWARGDALVPVLSEPVLDGGSHAREDGAVVGEFVHALANHEQIPVLRLVRMLLPGMPVE